MRALLLAVAIVPVSCTELGGWSVIDVDCGSTEDPHTKYEAAGRECVWDAYSRGPKREVGRDVADDRGGPDPEDDTFGGEDGGVLTWRCSAIAKHEVSSDGSRYDFYLSGCTGPSASTTFP
ncbi:MAG TPA: hypothetical protein VGK15_05265 [Candidatus Limnocylindria bacterium]